MGKRKYLFHFVREMFIGLRTAGASITRITTLLGFPWPTVSRVFRGWQLTKNSLSGRYCSGWKRLVNARGQRRVAGTDRSDRKAATWQNTAECNAGASNSTSHHITRRNLQRMVSLCSRLSKVSLVTQENRKRHLLWVYERRNRSLQER